VAATCRSLLLSLLLAEAVTAGLAPGVVCPTRRGPQAGANGPPLTVAGQLVELTITAVTNHTVRVSAVPIQPDGSTLPTADEPIISSRSWPRPVLRTHSLGGARRFDLPNMQVEVSSDPLTIAIVDRHGRTVQQLKLSEPSGGVSFALGGAPVFGLGEGGKQFDRRGGSYPLKSGQAAPDLDVIGARVPIPWLIGASGWGLFFHLPFGASILEASAGASSLGTHGHRCPSTFSSL
jgi:alpha-glucosidase